MPVRLLLSKVPSQQGGNSRALHHRAAVLPHRPSSTILQRLRRPGSLLLLLLQGEDSFLRLPDHSLLMDREHLQSWEVPHSMHRRHNTVVTHRPSRRDLTPTPHHPQPTGSRRQWEAILDRGWEHRLSQDLVWEDHLPHQVWADRHLVQRPRRRRRRLR